MADGNGSTASELRDQLELAQAIAHMGSWHWDLATGVVTWSDELYRIYGLAPRSRDITFEFFMSCIVPSERQRIQREIEQALQHHGRFTYRELITRPTGEVRTLDTIGEVSVRDGVVTGLMGTCRDITDEARRDERLTFYGEVFEHAQVCLSAWQLDTRHDPAKLRLVAFNNATEQLAGESLSAKMGQPMLENLSVGGPHRAGAARALDSRWRTDSPRRVIPARGSAERAVRDRDVVRVAEPGHRTRTRGCDEPAPRRSLADGGAARARDARERRTDRRHPHGDHGGDRGRVCRHDRVNLAPRREWYALASRRGAAPARRGQPDHRWDGGRPGQRIVRDRGLPA